MGPTVIALAALAAAAPSRSFTTGDVTTATWEQNFELTCDSVMIEHEGKQQSIEELLGGSAWHFEVSGEQRAGWRDEAGVDREHASDFVRTFDRLQSSYQVRLGAADLLEEAQAATMTSPLVDHPIQVRRRQGAWSAAFVEGDDTPDATWLEGMAWIPGANPPQLGQAEAVTLDGKACASRLRPLGRPACEAKLAEGTYPELVLLLVWSVDPCLHPTFEGADLEARRDGERVVLDLQLDEVVELGPAAEEFALTLGVEQSMVELFEQARLEIFWEGQATWSAGSVTLDADVQVDLVIDFQDGYVLRATFTGGLEQERTWE